jgi:hypothetical protein
MRLREDLYWCACGGRVVFLDLRADRYFGLSPDLEGAFLDLAGGAAGRDAVEKLRGLIARGLLLGEGSDLARGPGLLTPVADLFEEAPERARVAEVLRALAFEVAARWQLRHRSLLQATRWIMPVAPKPPAPTHGRDAALRRIVGAFGAVNLILPERDRCLPRALAVQAACRRRGIAAKLVFGVRQAPFGAHAWVQMGDRVVAGDFEQVRLFTPIAAFP